MNQALRTMLKAEPGDRDWKERIIERATDLPDADAYVANDSVPIVEYVLTRDPAMMLRVARREEDILADVRWKIERSKELADTRSRVFHFLGVRIVTMDDAALACGSWQQFCRQVADKVRNDMPDSEGFLEHVASLVPEELRGVHRSVMRRRIEDPDWNAMA